MSDQDAKGSAGPTNLSAAREVAIAAARAGGAVAMRFFGRGPAVYRKSDMTPVTEADVAAEQAIVAILHDAYPTYGFWAEESSPLGTLSSAPTWIVDPIDGTNQFMRGIPFFATLIALALDGQPVVGVSYAPALDELLVATRGGGATVTASQSLSQDSRPWPRPSSRTETWRCRSGRATITPCTP